MNAGLILARTDSNRLPNKALLDLGGKRLIQWSIDGLKTLKGITPILLTSDRHIDDPLIEIAQKNHIDYFRGDLENIAKRVLDCIQHFEIDYFARINGDSPFLNRSLLEEGFAIINDAGDFDLVTNLIPRAFPYALSIEIMKSRIFIENYNSLIPDFQEHITSWFYKHIDLFKVFKMEYPFGNDHHLSVAIDTEEDLKRLNAFIQKYPNMNIPEAPLHTLVNNLKKHNKSYL